VHDHVALHLQWQGVQQSEVMGVVDRALAEYCARHGDKTVPGVGDAVLGRHTEWSAVTESGALLELHGLSGHMGATERLDGAITKACTVVRALVRERARRGGAWEHLRAELAGGSVPGTLDVEGGQGFLPTHGLEEVSSRMRTAVAAGIREYLSLAGLGPGDIQAHTSFDKLHNAAFERPVDGPATACMAEAARAAGACTGREPVAGWNVSCDARIFALEYPDAEILTFGPGRLSVAHSADEHVAVDEVVTAAETLARMALLYGRR
jgi:acetylornithine deacetylase/succinyl-diaminopimelate desuccinylase-like protein